MDLYEYQGKQYFARFGIPTSPGGVADTVDEAVAQADAAGYPVVVKAQVKVGGRGKAGGIKLADDADEVRQHARPSSAWTSTATSCTASGSSTPRTSPRSTTPASPSTGRPSSTSAWSRPRAASRSRRWPRPTRRHRQAPRRPRRRACREAAREWVEEAGLDPEARDQPATLLVRLYRCYVEGDCDLAEINPLILTTDGRVHALDAKVTLDDNAAFRHPEWEEFADDSDVRRARAAGQGEGPQLHRPVGVGRHHRQRGRSGHEHARRRDPGRRAAPPTSSTSGAVPTPMSWPPPSR